MSGQHGARVRGRSRGAGAPRRGPAARRAEGADLQLGEQGLGHAQRRQEVEAAVARHLRARRRPPELAQAEQPARIQTHRQPGRCAANTPEGSVYRTAPGGSAAGSSARAKQLRGPQRCPAPHGALRGRRPAGRARAARAGGARAPLPQRRRQPRGEDLEEAQLVKLGIQVEQNHVLCAAQTRRQCRCWTQGCRWTRGSAAAGALRACRGGAPS